MSVHRTPGLFTIIFLAALAASIFAAGREEQDSFVMGSIKALPGEVVSGYLKVPEKDGVGTRIPVTIIHGKTKGTVLALVAGVHGYEYPPILALYRLKGMVDPSTLEGTLVLVHIANLPSFQRRTIYYNPFDWKNLNRVFPGDANGTLSQRIARVLNDKIIRKSDCVIDMHCGDGNEALIPYTYWMISRDKALNEATKKLALAFGIPTIIIDQERTRDSADSKYFGNTAILQGKAAITTEAGFLGGTDEKSIAMNIKGALNVMRHLKMIAGEPEPAAEPVWIDKYEVVNSNWDGLFYPLAEMGHYVAKGQKVGTVKDLLGNLKEEVRAPFAGIVLYIIGTPPTIKGEPLFEVGRVQGD